MAPTIRDSTPANADTMFDSGLQRYVNPSKEAAAIRTTDAKANTIQNTFGPSLVQDSASNNKWPNKLPLDPSHIEVRPTTLASLKARRLDGEPDNEPNAINCGSFGLRGGRRCRDRDDNGEGPVPDYQDGGNRPKLIEKHDDLELSRRETNKKGFESHPCSDPHAKDAWYCKDLALRDPDLTSTLGTLEVVKSVDSKYDIVDEDPMPNSSKPGYWSYLGQHNSYEDRKHDIAAYHARNRAQKTATIVGVVVTVVVGVGLLGLIFWYLRRRSKRLASARERVAELELETRREGDGVRGGEAGKR